MAQQVTESIWHFIGYMHLEELLNKTPIHYAGAKAYHLQAIGHSHFAPAPYEAAELFAVGRGSPSVRIELPGEQKLVLATRPMEIEIPDVEVAFSPPAVNPPLDLPSVLARAAAADPERATARAAEDASEPGVSLKVTATYTVGGSQYNVIHVAQANTLFDADVLRGDPTVLLEAGLESAKLHAAAEGSEELVQLVQKALDLLPSDLIPDAPADGVDHQHTLQENGLGIEVPLESDVVAEAVTAGRYVDGARVGDAGTSTEVIQAQVARIGAAVEAATPVEHSPAETRTASDGALHVETGPAPTGGAAHEAITGANDLVNAAVLYDLADAAGSMIIRGDVNVTDAIVQVNVLQDNDAVNASGAGAGSFSSTDFLEAAVAQSQAGSGNTTANEAVFVQEEGPVYGNVTLGGGPGSLIWQIDYVQGSFYDLTTVEQYNVNIDTDIGEQTTTGTHFVATLGENGALNLVQLQELGASYDLIIVGGHYYELNAVVQVNVLLDDDIVDQSAGAADQSIDTEGNTLENDAAIVRIGGDSYKPLDGDPAELAGAIGSMQAEFDYSLASGLPGNGTDTLKVLYVTGDYYDYNILLQTNVLDDSDQVAQVAADAQAVAAGQDAATAGTGDFAQTVEAGNNTLQNVALLVNVGSTSDYQYVGGEIYEDTLLVQAEIVADGDDTGTNDLHPDTVATIAALSGSADDAVAASDTPLDHPDTSASVDVIGGILT